MRWRGRAHRGSVIGAVCSILLVGGCAPAVPIPGAAAPPGRAGVQVVSTAGHRPDIVLILMDDFSLDLFATMSRARRMRAEGAWYRNAFAVDSLCCPSRASIFTGQMPHQTRVLTNIPLRRERPIGGFEAFVEYGNDDRSFNVALQGSGYTTGFIGKYLNRYEARVVDGREQPPPRVRGWNSWQAITGGGYNGWGFSITRLGRDGKVHLEYYPKPPRGSPRVDRTYATNVAARKAVAFIARHRPDRRPYFLEVAVYAPHRHLDPAYPGDPLFPPAMADRAPRGRPAGGNCGPLRCGALTLDDLPGYDDPRGDNAPTYLRADGGVQKAPAWRTNRRTLTRTQALASYRDRARMVQSVDRMIGRIRAAVGPNTYVLLTADNGLHLGQHQLDNGKGTPYDSDTRVPLVVVGPGVVPGPRDQYVSGIDLASTIEQLAGLRPPSFRSGISFADTLRNPRAAAARYVFFEHTHAPLYGAGRDPEGGPRETTDIVPSHIAVRGDAGLLVRFDLDISTRGTDYAWELYRYDVPWEDTNVFATDHGLPWAVDLMERLRQWRRCDPAECRAARR